MNPSSSKHPRSPPDSELSPMPSAKRRQTRVVANSPPGTAIGSNVSTDINQSLTSTDSNDGYWTSFTPLEPLFADYLCDWENHTHTNEAQSPSLDLGGTVDTIPLVSSLPTLQDAASQAGETARLNPIDNVSNGSSMTASPTDSPTTTLPSSCNCIQSLADTLEKVSVGDADGDIDQSKGFDDWLLYLHDGIRTCRQVLPCKFCCVCAVNSMLVITTIQQLVIMSQGLCRQLLAYRRKSRAGASVDRPRPLLLTGEICIGKYQIQGAAVHLEFMFTAISMHLKDLQQLLDQIQKEIKRGTKAFKLLSGAANDVRKASNDLRRMTIWSFFADSMTETRMTETPSNQELDDSNF
ncbi:hypothetical protein F5884DRAFT_260601 [Xylogone sp. PMI_703]|nr:hypothetical protein F5884DRAFT_260601 [Xylogone sp. PMI_703]